MRKKGKPKASRATPPELSTVAVATRALTKAATGEPGARARRSAVQLAGASAARAALGGHPPVEAVMLALFGGLGVLLGFSLDAAIDARKERGRAFVDGLREAYARDDADADAIDEVLQERARDPVVAEAIFEAVKRFFDAPSAEAAPALGRLLGEYIRDKREADHVFRGVARLLADLSTSEIRTLRAFATAARTHPGRAHATQATHVHVGLARDRRDEATVLVGGPSQPDSSIPETSALVEFGPHQSTSRVVCALRSNLIADDGFSVTVSTKDAEPDAPSFGQEWHIEVIVPLDAVDTLARILM